MSSRRAGARVAILVEDLYQDLEVWYPYYRLQEAGHHPVFVGTGSKDEYHGKYGYPVIPHKLISRIRPADFSAVIVPGGFAPDLLRRYPAVLRFVKEMDRRGNIVAAICHAGWVLVSAGILRGRTVTGFSAIKDDLINAGARFIDRDVVRDRNLITSRKPDDLPAFMRELLTALRSVHIVLMGA